MRMLKHEKNGNICFALYVFQKRTNVLHVAKAACGRLRAVWENCVILQKENVAVPFSRDGGLGDVRKQTA